MRALLRQADDFARAGRLAEAVALYDQAADVYEREGFALKAIALSRQILSIAAGRASELEPARLSALRRLVRIYPQLGLTADAAEAKRLLQERPGRPLH